MSDKVEVETLLNGLMPLVQKNLSTEGILYPFAAIMTVGGKREIIFAEDPSDITAKGGQIPFLTEALHHRIGEGSVQLVVIAVDVTANLPGEPDGSDAIQFRFEHRSGYTAEVFVPYSAGPEGLIFGKLYAQTGDQLFFAPEDDTTS